MGLLHDPKFNDVLLIDPCDVQTDDRQ